MGNQEKFYVRFVRGGPYGENRFEDLKDGTILDHSSGLMWTQQDSGQAMSWEEALAYAEESTAAGYRDWRLPNAKELQYIVDYSRAPDVTNSAAIDPRFQITAITNEAGERDYPYFWTGTTHLDGPIPANRVAYVAFGRALGKMRGQIMDVHGAGAQRSAPKVGRDRFHGPQGDAVRVENFVRLVRGGEVDLAKPISRRESDRYPEKIRVEQGQRDSTRPMAKREQGGERRSLSERRGRGSRFIDRLDRDGDWRVSREEFDGPPDRFDFHDENGDGYLSANEVPRRAPPNRRPPRRAAEGW